MKLTPIALDSGCNGSSCAGFTQAPYQLPAHADTSGSDRIGYIFQGHPWPKEELTRLAEGELGVYLDGHTASLFTYWDMKQHGMPQDVLDQFAEAAQLDLSALPDMAST